MSNHLKGYSGYQKRVVKGVADVVGERPFCHEKTNNNHLQIKVKGINRVFYTSSTPSDHRTFDNFISDVKSELKQLQQREKQATVTEIHPERSAGDEKKIRQDKLDKIIKTSIKRIRMMIDKIKKDELQALLENQTQDPALVVKGFRENLIRREIDQAIKNKNKQEYITPAALKQCEKSIEENLNFMMPTIACYHEQLSDNGDADETSASDDRCVGSPAQAPEEIRPETASENTAESSPQPLAESPAQAQPENTQSRAPVEIAQSSDAVAATAEASALHELVKEKANKRISIIKALPKHHIEALMADFQKALEQKHQDDIRDLVSLIRDRGVTLEELEQELASA